MVRNGREPQEYIKYSWNKLNGHSHYFDKAISKSLQWECAPVVRTQTSLSNVPTTPDLTRTHPLDAFIEVWENMSF